MLSDFLVSNYNLLEELFRVTGWGIFLLGTLSSAFYMIVQIFKGEGFYYRNTFERFFLLIAVTFVWFLLIVFVGFGFYNATKVFVAYQYANNSKDAVAVEKYYNIKPKDPSSYSDVFKDKIAVSILHEDSKEYQVEYNEHIYKIEK